VTVGVTAAAAPPASAPPGTSAGITPAENNLPLGAVPAISAQTGQLIGAGNAAGLFPAIVPSSTPSPSPSPGVHAQASSGAAQPVAEASALGLDSPVLTAQVAGLAVLALGVLLAVTRLSVRKRPRSPKQGG
jgi:hypothetical protein